MRVRLFVFVRVCLCERACRCARGRCRFAATHAQAWSRCVFFILAVFLQKLPPLTHTHTLRNNSNANRQDVTVTPSHDKQTWGAVNSFATMCRAEGCASVLCTASEGVVVPTHGPHARPHRR